MNILYIANARIPTPRAYGLQIMKTCEALAHAGAVVDLVVPTRSSKTDADPFVYYSAQKNFALTTLPTPDLLFLGPIGFLFSTIWFAERVHFGKKFWQADAVYSRDPLLLLQYILLGRPLVFEAHAPPSFASRIVARHAKKVVVISKGLLESYRAAGVSEAKLVLAPDAVDVALFREALERAEARQQLGLPAEAQIVLYAGHLYPRKGADTLAATAVLVPEAHFYFVGGAGRNLEDFKKKWEALANVSILGPVSHKKIPHYLRAADVLALPNTAKDADAARYTSPMKLFEYMASGTPIVASDVPAIREILPDDVAFFSNPDNPQAFAAAIRAALVSSEARIRAARAQQLIKKYSWDARAQRILHAFYA